MRVKRTVQVLAAVILVMAAPAFAGPPPGSITFSPSGAASIPALGGAALVLLTLLLAFIGWVSLRKNGPGAVPVVTFALALASASGAGGLTWLQTAEAGAPVGGSIIDSAGQTFSISAGNQNNYTNNTGVPMQPTSITLGSCSLATNSDTCTLDTPFNPGASCNLDCTVAVSDSRLKESVVRVATATNGLPLYEYSYIGQSAVYRGVMAQDVLFHTPEAVHLMGNGYLAVDYGMLSLELERIR